MSTKLMKYKFRNESFSGYGLNKYRNFLSAPECECGCGEKGNILLDSNEDLFGFMGTMLMEYDCNCCAIFAHAYDGSMYAAIKFVVDDFDDEIEDIEDDEDMPIHMLASEEEDVEFFQQLDAEIGFCCYGLLIEVKNGEWKIIED